MNIETGNWSSRVFIFFFFYLRVNFVAQYNNLSNELSILYRFDYIFFSMLLETKRHIVENIDVNIEKRNVNIFIIIILLTVKFYIKDDCKRNNK